MLNNVRRIDDEDPILKDKELIQTASNALGDEKEYGSGDATIQTVRERLHKPVPLVEILCEVKTPRELRDTDRKDELIMILRVINNEISMTDLKEFKELKEYHEEEYLAKNTIGSKDILNLKSS